MSDEIYCVTQYVNDPNRFFISPTTVYLEKYGRSMLDQIYPEYSFGAKDKFAICEISSQTKNNITTVFIERFDNYVTRYRLHNSVLVDSIYCGLGALLLNTVLQKYEDSVSVSLLPVKSEKLIKYYHSLSFSFEMHDDQRMHSTVGQIKKTLAHLPILKFAN